jgi:hypothetical protein
MNLSKTQLLVACAASTFITSAAQAQVALPAITLRGGGASSVAEIVPRTLNCVGRPGSGLNQVGTNAGTLSTVAPGNYAPTTPSSTNPEVDCSSSYEIQPSFEGKYISIGYSYWIQLFTPNTTSNNTTSNKTRYNKQAAS